MKFKKIYIEITNVCNLNCSFCSIDNRTKAFMSVENFENIMKKINDYTDYIYLHVKGEPLLHPEIQKIIKIANKYNKKINITTNGVLLKEKANLLSDVRQINISLQSLTNKNYLSDILEVGDRLSKNTFIEYRLWNESKYSDYVLEEILKKYNTTNNKLANNIYLTKDKSFIWPSLDNKIIRDKGTCFGTRHHIGILVDGTVIPCCLDSNAIINFGNIYNMTLDEIITSPRFLNMKCGFLNNKLEEELCQKCGLSFLEKE